LFLRVISTSHAVKLRASGNIWSAVEQCALNIAMCTLALCCALLTLQTGQHCTVRAGGTTLQTGQNCTVRAGGTTLQTGKHCTVRAGGTTLQTGQYCTVRAGGTTLQTGQPCTVRAGGMLVKVTFLWASKPLQTNV